MSAQSGRTGADALAPDAWLSGLLQRPAFRLTGTAGLQDGGRVLADKPVFVTARCPAPEVSSLRLLQDAGFRVVDAALTFDTTEVLAERAACPVRFAKDTDRADVVTIAGSTFRFSRFHLDPVFPVAIAHRIKAAWADNFFNGSRGDGMVVAEHEGRVAGFLQLLWSGDTLVIDLVAVAPEAARLGLARSMIGFAAVHGTGDGRRPGALRVGTQAANTASCRLYEKLGFRLGSAAFVLHHHGAGGSYPTTAAA